MLVYIELPMEGTLLRAMILMSHARWYTTVILITVDYELSPMYTFPVPNSAGKVTTDFVYMRLQLLILRRLITTHCTDNEVRLTSNTYSDATYCDFRLTHRPPYMKRYYTYTYFTVPLTTKNIMS